MSKPSENNNIKKYIEKTYNKSAKSFHELVKEKLAKEEKLFVVTANPETLMIAEENEEFKKVLLDKKTIIVPDGIGVLKGAKILGIKMEETITGVELCTKLFEYLNDMKKNTMLIWSQKRSHRKTRRSYKNKISKHKSCRNI